jgi:hypothetical protein
MNVNGLPSKIDEIRNYLQNPATKFDVFSCGESKLTSSHPDRYLHIDGYSFVRNDRRSRK